MGTRAREGELRGPIPRAHGMRPYFFPLTPPPIRAIYPKRCCDVVLIERDFCVNDRRNFQLLPDRYRLPLPRGLRQTCTVLTFLVPAVSVILGIWFWTPEDAQIAVVSLMVGLLSFLIFGYAALQFTGATELRTVEHPERIFFIVDPDGVVRLAEPGTYNVERDSIFGLMQVQLLRVERRMSTGKLFAKTLELDFYHPINLAYAAMFYRWRDGLSVYHLKVFDAYAADYFEEELECSIRSCPAFRVRIVEPLLEEELELSS